MNMVQPAADDGLDESEGGRWLMVLYKSLEKMKVFVVLFYISVLSMFLNPGRKGSILIIFTSCYFLSVYLFFFSPIFSSINGEGRSNFYMSW